MYLLFLLIWPGALGSCLARLSALAADPFHCIQNRCGSLVFYQRFFDS